MSENKQSGRAFIWVVASVVILGILIGLVLYVLSPDEDQPIPAVLDQPPKILIMSNEEIIDWNLGLNQWNGAKYDRQDTLIALMEGKEVKDLAYVKNGEPISIEFLGTPPETLSLSEAIVNEEGREVYTYREVRSVDLLARDTNYVFDLTPNPAGHLSSHTSTYKKGGLLRGYRLTCSWGDNSCEYGFVIRSDVDDRNEAPKE